MSVNSAGLASSEGVQGDASIKLVPLQDSSTRTLSENFRRLAPRKQIEEIKGIR